MGGVSCPTTTNCIAVGGSSNQLLAESWNGSTWWINPTPGLVGNNHLLSVSCSSASAASRVGVTTAFKTLALHWDGSSWSTQTTSNPAVAVQARLEGATVRCGTDGASAIGHGYGQAPWLEAGSGRTGLRWLTSRPRSSTWTPTAALRTLAQP
jgi:hypothetical protein